MAIGGGSKNLLWKGQKVVTVNDLPSLSGGSAAGNDATVVGGVTVSGHTITVAKKTLTAGSNITITGSTTGITIAATDTTYTFTNKAATLAWNTTVTIATVGGTDITVKLPANPNSDTKNTAGSTNSTSKLYLIGATSQAANPTTYSNSAVYATNGSLYATAVYGAVWNDYAEFRNQTEEIEPGYCVISSPNGKVSKTTLRLCPCDGIVSDTYGFAIGETNDCKTPLATSGRVLAYYSGDIADYTIGDAVCADADGKISKMTREEIREWPDRIVGIVSEFPEYETWGSGNIKVDGRIWIKVR